jgi:hypothetical protein
MNFATKILSAAIVAGVFMTGAVEAGDINGVKSMKPFEGVSFDVGTKHAVGYFYKAGHTCRLVLTLADAPSFDTIQTFSATREEASISAGDVARFNLSEDKTFEFACNTEALAMNIKEIEHVVAGATR